jgi:hypothetical protein
MAETINVVSLNDRESLEEVIHGILKVRNQQYQNVVDICWSDGYNNQTRMSKIEVATALEIHIKLPELVNPFIFMEFIDRIKPIPQVILS